MTDDADHESAPERLRRVQAEIVAAAKAAGRESRTVKLIAVSKTFDAEAIRPVIAAGQRVLTILDLNDVYMTIYLPAHEAGKLMLGDEARTILDPVPQYVLPNTISFIATEAQFTPKSVETAEEREKLMFRVKLQGDPKVLDKYHRQVQTGVRGLGFVRTDPKVPWPKELDVKLPQ